MAALRTKRRAPMGLADLAGPHPPAPESPCETCTQFQAGIDEASDPRSDGYDPSKALDLRILMNRHMVAKAAS